MTTYYVRVLTDIFSLNPVSAQGISETGHYENTIETSIFDTPLFYVKTTPNRIFNTIPKTLYYLDFTPNILSYSFTRSVISDSILKWFLADNGNYEFHDSEWASFGWTNPSTDISTFVTEICTGFDSKNTNGVISQNDNINLLLFRYNFRLSSFPTRFYYYPVFYPGNDSNRDFTVVI
jgi:hypothetical protein